MLRDLCRDILAYMRETTWMGTLLGSVAVLSLLISMHADVFEQYPEPLSRALGEIWDGITNSGGPEINLSILITEPVPEAHQDLYVFALDTSLSMTKVNLEDEELRAYKRDIAYESMGDSDLRDCIDAAPPGNGTRHPEGGVK